MKKYLGIIAGLAAAAFALTVCAQEASPLVAPAVEKGKAAEQKEVMAQPVYACPDCHVLAMKAGKCSKCGMEMKAMRLLAVKDGEATLCACGAGCKCDAKGIKDGKCACGKDIGQASVKGMYVCPEGCPVVSDKAGKCPGCGKEMKQVK